MENWKAIAEAPGYEISDKGRVRNSKGQRPGIMHPKTKANGYLEITMYVNGKYISRTVHRLVAMAFLLPDPTRSTINHKNDKKKDNRYTNLEWNTVRENNAHSAHKRLAVNNPKRAHKLTLEKVFAIRLRHAANGDTLTIAKDFGVTECTVRNLVYGRSWVSVTRFSAL